MGKSKRNKTHRQRNGYERRDERLDAANADVRAAEAALLAARRRAAQEAARAINGQRPADPAEQAAAFFNRPGDYYLAQFEIRPEQGEPIRAQCALKADEVQRDYLLEVLRQIRGGFGERARISLSLAQTQHTPADAGAPFTLGSNGQPPAGLSVGAGGGGPSPAFNPRPTATHEAMARVQAEHARAVADAEHAPSMWDLEADALGRVVSDLTREELQAQLPGMTRAEAAAELGVDPADIGGEIRNTGDLELEKIAAELGVSPLDLEPINMRGGGRAYAVKPRHTQPPAGRHTRPEPRETNPGGAS